MHGVPARCRWAVASPVIGAGLVVLCTVLSLTPVARTGLVTIAAIGPFLWLMRAGREVVRLFDGRSTPRRVLVYVGLLVALTIVELATIYNWMRHSFGGMTSRVAPLYFSISTFTTTGYGDIHPLTSGAQLVAGAQMLLDWTETSVVVGVVLAAMVGVLGRRCGQTWPWDPKRQESTTRPDDGDHVGREGDLGRQ